jgi:monovalent cation:H+ antiporter, CPA1 family
MAISAQTAALYLLIIALVAMVSRRVRLPYTVGLVISGMTLALANALGTASLTSDLVVSVLLPPLVYEAACQISWQELRKNITPIVLLATVGVVLSAGFTSLLMTTVFKWPLGAGLLFATLISATDPVSVIATLKDANVTGRLRLLVEAESLFNDGTVAVIFTVLLGWATSGHVSPQLIVIDVVREILGGVVCGAIIGALMIWIAGKTEDHLVEITLTVVAAYGSFLLAQSLHMSGVLATLTTGLILGNIGPLGAISDNGREAVHSFWEFAGFLVNSIVFLLVGTQGAGWLSKLVDNLPIIGAASVIVLGGRALAVYPLCNLLRDTKHKIVIREQHVLVWGGLRGALALALVMSLPSNFPMRDKLLVITYGVVAVSIIVQGLSFLPLLKKLHIVSAK